MNGIFVHWGIYSIPAFSPPIKAKNGLQNGSEWYLGRMKRPFLYGKQTREFHEEHYPDQDYYDFLPIFEEDSKNWNPQLWVDVFLKCRAQYVIFTVKHHDGVCLYPSKYSDISYGVYSTARDYVGELVELLKQNNIKVGLYYSLMQWNIGKKGAKFNHYLTNIVHKQLKEITKKYNPDILWADGDWTNTVEEWKSVEFLKWLYSRNKNILVNSRWGSNFISYRNKFPWLKRISYLVPTDRYQPKTKLNDKWEHVNTISTSWGYKKNQKNTDYKKIYDLVHIMKRTRELGGSFVLNLGPMSNGNFDPKEVKIIEMINLKESTFNFDNLHIKKCISCTAKDMKISTERVVSCLS